MERGHLSASGRSPLGRWPEETLMKELFALRAQADRMSALRKEE